MTKKKDRVTRRELAGRLNVVMQTVTKWEQAGLPVLELGRKGKPSIYSEKAVRLWLSKREKQASDSGIVDVARQRARKEQAQAVLAEQMYAQRAGKLLPAEDVAKIWSAEIAAVRSVILSSYTTHADRVFRAATTGGLPGVELALKDLAYEVLRELANPDRPVEKAS
jgi:phage terminase Nu1 subunit (DNA packaging protein)